MRHHLLCLILFVSFVIPVFAIFTLSASPDSLVYSTQPGFYDAQFIGITNTNTETTGYSLLTNPPSLLANQVAYFPFDNSYTDLMTNTSGTFTGTGFIQNRFIENQKALHFNGNSSEFICHTFGLENSFSYSFWAKPQATLSMFGEGYYPYGLYTRYLLFPEWGGNGTRAGLGVALGTNGIMVIEHATNYMPCLISLTGNFTGWNHFTIVFSNHIPKLYVNGILLRTGIPSQKATTYTSSLWGGGGYGHFRGDMDDLCVYNTALTQEQVTAAAQFNDEARYSIQPRSGTLSSGQTAQVLVRMIDNILVAGVYNDVITLCQPGIPPLSAQVPVTINVSNLVIPLAPEGITAILQPNMDVLVEWTAVTQAVGGTPITPAGYLIYSLEDPYNPASGIYLGTTTSTQFLHSGGGLIPADRYKYYYVTAYIGE